MRLICPNCDAQYEVVDDVIPVEGRDVQCSNCGHTWFQHHPDHMPEPEAAAADVPETIEPQDAPAPNEERSPPPETARKELDPGVADILREEAERETQARAKEAEALESQPELGLDTAAQTDADKRAQEARDRMAQMRGEDPDTESETAAEAAATAAAIGSRRDLLPDIDEINSTLRSTSDRKSDPAADAHASAEIPSQKRGGFRRGFVLMVVLALILVCIYIFAPQIAEAVPQVDPYLSAYVAQMDQLRMWLDGRVQGVLTWLDTTAAQSQ